MYGSWNTIWTSRPRRRRSRSDRAGVDRSCPQARMVPAVGRSRPTIILATVVLPEPDSPTIARDPPSGSENETSSTAVRGPNSLRRALTSSTDSAMQRHLEAAAQLFCAHASAQAAVERDERRPGLAAYVEKRTPQFRAK